MLTTDQLATIKARADAAYPGPWLQDGPGGTFVKAAAVAYEAASMARLAAWVAEVAAHRATEYARPGPEWDAEKAAHRAWAAARDADAARFTELQAARGRLAQAQAVLAEISATEAIP